MEQIIKALQIRIAALVRVYENTQDQDVRIMCRTEICKLYDQIVTIDLGE